VKNCRTVFCAMAIVMTGWAVAQFGDDPNMPTVEEQHEGFFPLFNGTDLAGWLEDEGQKSFTVEDDLLVVTGTAGQGWLWTSSEYANFVLRLEFRIEPEGQGNSGVGIRAEYGKNPAFEGMEIQIIRPDWETDWQSAGALYAVVPPGVNASKPAGEWNEMEILAEGTRIRTTLNGQVLYDVRTTDYTVEDDWRKTLDTRPSKGHIALQNHGNRVEFRRIRLKELAE
jgi:hypothetical protein